MFLVQARIIRIIAIICIDKVKGSIISLQFKASLRLGEVMLIVCLNGPGEKKLSLIKELECLKLVLELRF